MDPVPPRRLRLASVMPAGQDDAWDPGGEPDARAFDPPSPPGGRRPARVRREHTRGRWRPRLATVLLMVLSAAAGAGGLAAYQTWNGAGSVNLTNTAVIPYWNLAAATDAVLAHRSEVDAVSPWIYGVSDSGDVVPLTDRPDVQTVALQRLREAGLTVVPTIANYHQGRWTYDPVARLLHSPALMRRHVEQIAALATAQGWNGVDIDYEELRAGDRDRFTAFVVALADRLHADGKTLTVDVFAKTSDAGYGERNQAQDYPALGRAVDQLRVMAYDYHWSTSEPGPIAPVGWVRDVLDYTLAHVPASKVLLGVPLYGYDWVGSVGQPVSWAHVYQLATGSGAVVRWDQVSESPWLTYLDGQGRRHTVWFENAYSSSTKFDLARRYGVHGVSLWMFGPEDDATWARLAGRTADGGPGNGIGNGTGPAGASAGVGAPGDGVRRTEGG